MRLLDILDGAIHLWDRVFEIIPTMSEFCSTIEVSWFTRLPVLNIIDDFVLWHTRLPVLNDVDCLVLIPSHTPYVNKHRLPTSPPPPLQRPGSRVPRLHTQRKRWLDVAPLSSPVLISISIYICKTFIGP